MEEVSLFQTILNLTPMLLLLGGLLYFVKKTSGGLNYSDYLKEHSKCINSQNDCIKEQTIQLKRIADILEEKNDGK